MHVYSILFYKPLIVLLDYMTIILSVTTVHDSINIYPARMRKGVK
jgi:hypothetical protein